MLNSEFFVAGGTLRPDAPSYVQRPADDELFNLALAGEFCYVLTPRQMGKSSLMIRTARRLGERGVKTVIIDLTRIGVDVSVEQWYLSLLTQLKRRLRLSTDPLAWWSERAALGHVQRFSDFVRDVILAEIEEKVVVFIDEIDTTLNLDFRDDFFAAIRAMYNARAEDPEFNRLTFALLGVASPPDLIKDRARTPFNIGHAITVQEFSQADAAVLRDGLDAMHPGQGEAVFDRIYYWTHGHPYLTQKLCLAVAESRNERWTDEWVDELVEKLFLSREARKEANLKFAQDRLLAHSQSKELLKLYQRVVRRNKVGDDGQSLLQNQLKLSGLVKVENGYLRIRNEIYSRAFNLDWIKANMPVDWMRRIAIASVITTLLLASLLYLQFIRTPPTQPSDAERAQTLIDSFRGTTSEDVDKRVKYLAELFQVSAYQNWARELYFVELDLDEQLDLFKKDNPQALGKQFSVIIQGLYTHLDDSPLGNDLLYAMLQTLRKLDEDNTNDLAQEIEKWIEGRDYAAQKDLSVAVQAYNEAIKGNPNNIGTRFDRALTNTQLGEYESALGDFDAVVQMARSGQLAPVPTNSPPTASALRFTGSTQIIELVIVAIHADENLLNAFYANPLPYSDLQSLFSTPSPTSSTPTPSPTPSTPTLSPTPSTPTLLPTPLTPTPTPTPSPTPTSTPSPTPTEEPSPDSRLIVLTTDFLRLRVGPDRNSNVITILLKYEALIVLDDADIAQARIDEGEGWIRVQTTADESGYVMASYVRQSPSFLLSPLVVYNTGALYVRTGPSVDSDVIELLFYAPNDGNALIVLENDLDHARSKIGQDNEWLYVETFTGIVGYVAAWLVQSSPLEIDLYYTDSQCDENARYRYVHIQGQGGNGYYRYFWNGELLTWAQGEGYTFEVPYNDNGDNTGVGMVISGYGQMVEKNTDIPEPDCVIQP